MSTNDVPGHVPGNSDSLAMGCWAEHTDGSLIFVESTEGGRVIYSVFDLAEDPITEYRDAMPEKGFKTTFSWKGSGIKWTWHDKTPFPWDRVIKAGARSGQRHADVEDQLNAAQRVARSRDLIAQDVDPDDYTQFTDVERPKPSRGIVERIQGAINELRR